MRDYKLGYNHSPLSFSLGFNDDGNEREVIIF